MKRNLLSFRYNQTRKKAVWSNWGQSRATRQQPASASCREDRYSFPGASCGSVRTRLKPKHRLRINLIILRFTAASDRILNNLDLANDVCSALSKDITAAVSPSPQRRGPYDPTHGPVCMCWLSQSHLAGLRSKVVSFSLWAGTFRGHVFLLTHFHSAGLHG